MNSKDLKNISNLSQSVLSESTTGQESFLDKWPYTSPYLEEKKKYKYKNCGCGKNPCKTYGKEAAPVEEGVTHAGLEKVASKLEKASKTHKKQAAKIRGHVKDMQSEELAPHLKKFDADNKRKFLESGKKAQAERQAKIDAYKKHKNEVLAKGGRPVDALDSWMQKNLKKEDYAPAAKLLESGLFTEEEIIKLTIG
tara:strand:- start:80 stop:667 length:588 start_codon:yes stop_codon:yes gene_type:complete